MPAPRPYAAGRTAPPSTAAAPLDDAVHALAALLVSIERSPTGPAAGAFRAAIRRRGQILVDTLGPASLAEALARVHGADPERTEEREAIITAAWVGLKPNSISSAEDDKPAASTLYLQQSACNSTVML